MAFLPSWVCVLVSSFCFSLARALDYSDLYPPLWEESPGHLSDYTVKNGTYIIDPWVFSERMGMYKILLTQTAPYFEKFGSENEQNLLWGLPLQNGWQYRSGRLADPTGGTECGYESDPLCISVDSWWADINYFLSAIPFLAAVDSGILGISADQVRLLPPSVDQERFCYDVSDCLVFLSEVMKKWSDFYKCVQSPSSTFQNLLKSLWTAHIFTLSKTVDTFEDRYVYYSTPETEFEQDWCVAVDYIGVSRIPTTLVRVYESQKGLPPRILKNTDIVPIISDFTVLQNTVLFLLKVLKFVNDASGSLSLTVWKIAMSTQNARNQILEVFDKCLGIPN